MFYPHWRHTPLRRDTHVVTSHRFRFRDVDMYDMIDVHQMVIILMNQREEEYKDNIDVIYDSRRENEMGRNGCKNVSVVMNKDLYYID